VDERGDDVLFCCIHCAEAWVKQQTTRPKAVWVTDESSGEEIEATSAYFVRSRVETNPVTRNRIHAFRAESDAEKHARECNGLMLDGPDRPFHECTTPRCPECNKLLNPQ
jgi:hypothetical protein